MSPFEFQNTSLAYVAIAIKFYIRPKFFILTLMSRLVLFLFVAVTSTALVFLKLGTASGLPIRYINSKLTFDLNAYAVSGILLYGLSFVLYMYLISKNDLGYVIPLTAGFVYVIVFTASYFIFHEVFTATKIIGIAMILGGLVFLNLNK